MFRIVLAGSVASSRATLEKLIEHGMPIVGVLGLEPANAATVSGHARLDDVCVRHRIPYLGFRKINSPEVTEQLRAWAPDLFFVVGLSQLVGKSLLGIPKMACIGFHPTKLPAGRGRAPLAWLVLETNQGAANFFVMGEGTDDGPILVQEPFDVTAEDDAGSVAEKIDKAIKRALDHWLPLLKAGEWDPRPQDQSQASWYGKRAPEDGWIDWSASAESIDRLIRASSRPHPGAYTFWGEQKLLIWQSDRERKLRYRGVTGRLLLADKKRGLLVQTGSGLLWINQIENTQRQTVDLKVGDRLGFYAEAEIHALRTEIKQLKAILNERTNYRAPS